MLEKKEVDLLKTLIIKKPYEHIISHPELKLNFWQKIKLQNLIKKRKSGIAFARLAKNKEFFNLDFLVTKDTLIPRPDTEILVEAVLENLKNIKNKKNILIDVGTGTACIPISILKTKNIFKKTFAIDISKKTLLVAKKNNKNHQTNIIFLKGNLLLPFVKQKLKLQDKSIFITANLPYLTLEQFKKEKSIQHEPKIALVAEDEGLALYKQMFAQVKKIRAKDIFIFCEIDPSQSSEIKKIIQNIFGNITIEIKKDLAGLDRTIYFKI